MFSEYRCPFEVPRLSFKQAQGILDESKRFGMAPVLETVIEMLEELEHPDQHYRIVQIAGTNGKTSTSRYTAALLKAEDYRVGLYTSPDLIEITERIELDQKPIAKEDFAYGISAAAVAGRIVNDRRRSFGERPYDITCFDLLTVAALVIFARARLDWVVLEVGLGGRWDATSATDPETVVITGIGLDHTRILGDTLEKIAAEKAAIIKAGRRCVLGSGVFQSKAVQKVIFDQCKASQVEPISVREIAGIQKNKSQFKASSDIALKTKTESNFSCEADFACDNRTTSFCVHRRPQRLGDELCFSVNTSRADYPEIKLEQPYYQAANAALAIASAEEALLRPLRQNRVQSALANCRIPGRFEILQKNPLIMIDACHNPQSVEVFLKSFSDLKLSFAPSEQKTALSTIKKSSSPALLCAVLADKDSKKMLELLSEQFSCIFCTQTKSSRALLAQDLADQFREQGSEVSGVFSSVKEAFSFLSKENIPFVALGSITLAGELAAIFLNKEN